MTFLSRPEGRLIWRMDNSRAWRFAPVQFRHAEVRQNSNLAGLISVEQRGVTLTADWCHIADKSGYYLLAAFNIRSDTNHLVTGIQRPGTGGYTVIISGGTNGTQHALWLIWGKAT